MSAQRKVKVTEKYTCVNHSLISKANHPMTGTYAPNSQSNATRTLPKLPTPLILVLGVPRVVRDAALCLG